MVLGVSNFSDEQRIRGSGLGYVEIEDDVSSEEYVEVDGISLEINIKEDDEGINNDGRFMFNSIVYVRDERQIDKIIKIYSRIKYVEFDISRVIKVVLLVWQRLQIVYYGVIEVIGNVDQNEEEVVDVQSVQVFDLMLVDMGMLLVCKLVFVFVGFFCFGFGGFGMEFYDGWLEGGGEDDGSCCVRFRVGVFGS